MALIQTDGTTARTIESAVVWRQGTISSGTAYVDLQYSDARSAGYGFFKLVLTGVRIPSKELALWGMQNSSSVSTTGYYGGHFAHGEVDALKSLSTSSTSGRFNNHSFFPISAKRNGEEGNIYLGHYTIYISDPVGSNITGINAAYPTVWWQGSHRVSSVLAANIQGGGVNNQRDSHYGVRFAASDGSSNMDRCQYTLTAYKEGGQY